MNIFNSLDFKMFWKLMGNIQISASCYLGDVCRLWKFRDSLDESLAMTDLRCVLVTEHLVLEKTPFGGNNIFF